MNTQYSLTHLADSTLVQKIKSLAAQDCRTTAELLAHIMEFDTRRLYLPAGYPSTFAYCVGELHLSEDATAKRIHAGRAARRFPVLFELLASGEIHLTGVGMLAPHLTESNARGLIAAARHKTKAQIDELLASRFPRPELPETIRPIGAETSHQNSQHAPAHVAGANALLDANLNFASEPIPDPAPIPERAPEPDDARIAPPVPQDEPRAKTMPVSADRFALQLTMDRSTHDKLRHAQELLGHQLRSGDLAGLFDRALDALIEKLEKQKFAATTKPRRSRARTSKPGEKNPRTIPAHVRRAVWARDREQCTFVSTTGHRCDARKNLEFDHIVPIARGGTSCISNLRLRCRAHNQLEAERMFGAGFMQTKREQAQDVRSQALVAAGVPKFKQPSPSCTT